MINWALLWQNEYVKLAVFIIGAFAAAKLVHFILKTISAKLTSKTKSDIDDRILQMLEKPMLFAILGAGVFFGLNAISVIKSYGSISKAVFYGIYVLIGAWFVSGIFSLLVDRWLRVKKKFAKTPQLISKIIAVIVYIIAGLMILDYFNVDITPLIATLGIGGLAVGLALQDTLANIFAGLHIISDRPVNVGDYVEIKDAQGHIEDIGWRSTRIRTLSNTWVIIPNSKLAESVVINDSLPEQQMSCLVQCGVGYGSDLDKVEKVTVDTAKKIQKTVKGAVRSHKPFIRYHTFGDSNINFTVILKIETLVDKFLVKHEFIKALKKAYDKNRIEISWPVVKIEK